MTFWLFRKPRLYRILAPLEPQPRPAPRHGHPPFKGSDEQFDETGPAAARRADPTSAENEEEQNRDGLAIRQSRRS